MTRSTVRPISRASSSATRATRSPVAPTSRGRRRKTSAWVLALAFLFACDEAPTGLERVTSTSFSSHAASSGRLIVNHDEWTFSESGFIVAPDAAQFALNVATWFAGGTPGNFLVYSNNFGLVGASLSSTMTGAGHSWTIIAPSAAPLPDLTPFDGVFLAGDAAPNQPLIDYVHAGGSIYLAAGAGICCFASPAEEAAAWNTLLHAFGLHYAPTYNFVSGVLPITSNHSIFAGVSSLFYDRGNSVSELDPADPRTDILEFSGAEGLFGVFGTAFVSNAAPIADAGEEQTVEWTIEGAGATTLDGSGSSDADGDALTYSWSDGGSEIATGESPTVALSLGTHTITLTVDDGNGESDTDEVVINVVDTTPPELSFSLDVTEISPPNHKMVTVASGISTTDACDDSPTLTVEVSSNEPANDGGDGNTEPDWAVIHNGDGTFDVQVRAERDGRGSGRVYTVSVTAVDASGNSVSAEGEVSVPHDKGKKGE